MYLETFFRTWPKRNNTALLPTSSDFLFEYSAELQNIQAVELVFKARNRCSRGGTALTLWLMPWVPNTRPLTPVLSMSIQPKSKQRCSQMVAREPRPFLPPVPSILDTEKFGGDHTHVTCLPLPYSGNVQHVTSSDIRNSFWLSPGHLGDASQDFSAIQWPGPQVTAEGPFACLIGKLRSYKL